MRYQTGSSWQAAFLRPPKVSTLDEDIEKSVLPGGRSNQEAEHLSEPQLDSRDQPVPCPAPDVEEQVPKDT